MVKFTWHVIYQCVQLFLVNTFAQYTESCRELQEKIRANVHGFSAKGTGFRGVQNTEEYGRSTGSTGPEDIWRTARLGVLPTIRQYADARIHRGDSLHSPRSCVVCNTWYRYVYHTNVNIYQYIQYEILSYIHTQDTGTGAHIYPWPLTGPASENCTPIIYHMHTSNLLFILQYGKSQPVQRWPTKPAKSILKSRDCEMGVRWVNRRLRIYVKRCVL